MFFNKRQAPKKEYKEVPVVVAKLPGEEQQIEGRFEEGSPTAVWLKKWARGELRAARTENDKLNNGLVKTTQLRARIEVLKEVLSLPETKESAIERILEDLDFEEDDPTYAGYG